MVMDTDATVDELRTIDNRLNGAKAIAYGGGVVNFACRGSRRLVEVDVNNPRKPVVVGATDPLPVAPVTLTMCNVSNIVGARTRLYENEYLLGDESMNFIYSPIRFDRSVYDSDFIANAKNVYPVEWDYNHFSLEMDFFTTVDRDGEVWYQIRTDDGVRAFANGVLVVEKWLTQGAGVDDERRFVVSDSRAGERIRWRVEYADAKAVAHAFNLQWSFDGGVSYQDIPNESISAVLRKPPRINDPLNADLDGSLVDEGFLGGEIFPDIGGCFAVGDGYLFAYPDGPASRGQNISVPGAGKTIATTSWHYLLMRVGTTLQMREAHTPTAIVDEHSMPFDVDFLMRGPRDLVYAIHRDGRFALIDCTDRITFVESGRFEHASDVVAGYYSATDDTIALACEDVGVRYYDVDDDDLPVYSSGTVQRDIQSIALHNYTHEFIATLDPAGDTQIRTALPRFAAQWQRLGFIVAHGDSAAVTHSLDDQYAPPVGVTFPFFPLPDVWWRFKDKPFGGTTFIADDGVSQMTGAFPSRQEQLVTNEFGVDNWVPNGKVEVDSLDGVTDIEAEWTMYLEVGTISSAAANASMDYLKIGSEFRVEGERTGTSTVLDSQFRAYVDGIEVSYIDQSAWTFKGGADAAPPQAYDQIVVVQRSNELSVWINGTHLMLSADVIPSFPVTNIEIMTNPVGGTINCGISDFRIYYRAVSEDQARSLSGGRLPGDEP